MFILVNHNAFQSKILYVFGSQLPVRMAIRIANQKLNANPGYVKMLNLLITVISYADNSKLNAQSIIRIMVVLRDWNHVLNTQLKINVLVY